MANYTYTKTKDGGQAVFRIFTGGQQVASARLMIATQDFESYAVSRAYRGRGLSYALTYALLAYCAKKHYLTPQVSNAHGVLLTSLPKVGFQQVGPTRIIKRTEAAASFLCNNVGASLLACQNKLAEYHITLVGPVKTSSGCVIL